MRDFADAGTTQVRPMPATGMIALRADLAAPWLVSALAKAGLTLPATRQIADGSAGATLWMAPDELLILCAGEARQGLVATLGAELSGRHHLVADVSDMRARFAVSGPGAAVALAKLMPVDIGRLTAGEVRRSRVGQVAAAFWATRPDTFELISFRSVAEYVHEALANAARHTEDLRLP